MSNCINRNLLTFLLWFLCLITYGQIDGVKIEVVKIIETQGNLSVELLFNLDDLELKSRDQRTFVPVIKSGSYEQELLPFVVSGDISHKVYERSRSLSGVKDNFTYEVKRNNNKTQAIPYTSTLQWKNWMSNAKLYVREIDCPSCEDGGKSTDIMLYAAGFNKIKNDTPEINPILNFVIPSSENAGINIKKGSIFSRSSGIDSSSPQSSREDISQFLQQLEKLDNDQDTKIEKISLTGCSSIEGSYASNLSLSESRVKEVEKRLLGRYSFPKKAVIVNWIGEDWSTLYDLVESSNIKGRDQILSIIKSVGIFEGREKQLMDIQGGEPYRIMAEEYFPKLRKVDYVIEYSGGDISSNELEKVYNESPSNLSCRQLFLLADGYGRGSDKFCEIVECAQKIYPNNSAMNLNVATICALRGDYDGAEKNALKSGNSAEALNNLGAIYLLKNDLGKAEKVLTKAHSLGSKDAQHNIIELNKMKNKM